MNQHPHELAPLLLDLGRSGIELARHPTDTTRLRHRPATLPPELSARVRLHRSAMARLLGDGFTPADDDAGYVLGERLGVADGLGMPTHPGSPAWLVAVGESVGLPDVPAEAPKTEPAPGLAERFAAVLSAALGVPVRASTLPPGGRFPGEPAWPRSPANTNSCHAATHGVDSGHGTTDGSNSGGGQGEQPNALRDRQGRGSGP